MSEDKIILVLNGMLPSPDYLSQLLKTYDSIICADGAANSIIKLGIIPTHIIGDMDSIDRSYYPNIENKTEIIFLPNQKFNDFHKSLTWLINHDVVSIDIIGLEGGRLDHFIGNFHILFNFIDNLDITVRTGDGVLYTVNKKRVFRGCLNKNISIFTNDANTSICSEGLKYELHEYKLDNFYSATLNVAIKDTIKIQSNKSNLLIFINHTHA